MTPGSGGPHARLIFSSLPHISLFSLLSRPRLEQARASSALGRHALPRLLRLVLGENRCRSSRVARCVGNRLHWSPMDPNRSRHGRASPLVAARYRESCTSCSPGIAIAPHALPATPGIATVGAPRIPIEVGAVELHRRSPRATTTAAPHSHRESPPLHARRLLRRESRVACAPTVCCRSQPLHSQNRLCHRRPLRESVRRPVAPPGPHPLAWMLATHETTAAGLEARLTTPPRLLPVC